MPTAGATLFWVKVILVFFQSLARLGLSVLGWLGGRRSRGESGAEAAATAARLAAAGLPVVLLPGNMGDATVAVAHYFAARALIFSPPLGHLSSCHDLACEIFYTLKGGRVDYGEAHAATHGHARFGALHGAGTLPG